MSRRTWIWVGAAAIPVAFVTGVWLGGAGDQQSVVSSSTGTTSTGPVATTTTSTRGATTTALSQISTTAAAQPPPGWSIALVVDVIDGDTVEVSRDGGPAERLRLIGTNAPEGGECYADVATAGLIGLVLGETVYLERVVSERDQFGRLLRYVWTSDDRLVNLVTVEEGWAIAREYPPDTSRAAELQAAQQRAMEAGAGLWAADACGEALAADVSIVHIEYDAAGNDNFNLNGEWVEITNGDDVPVDLGGWVLKDESASHRYTFPPGFSLPPGATVRVFTGCGEDTTDELYWCETGSAVWNNTGDTAYLLDPEGNTVFSYGYG